MGTVWVKNTYCEFNHESLIALSWSLGTGSEPLSRWYYWCILTTFNNEVMINLLIDYKNQITTYFSLGTIQSSQLS